MSGTPHALILAAGVGSRLTLPEGRPKCLADVGGRALIDRYLDALEPLGVSVTIAVGHQADRIAAHVGDRAQLVYHPDYRLGSVTTLHTALSAGHDGRHRPLLLLDGDVYAPNSFFAALAMHHGNALLVDIGTCFTDEQYMAGINAGRVQSLRRGPVPGHEADGEWVGFARLEPATVVALTIAVRAQVARGAVTGGYEDALASMLGDHVFGALPTANAPWTEIDFPHDLDRARTLAAAQ